MLLSALTKPRNRIEIELEGEKLEGTDCAYAFGHVS